MENTATQLLRALRGNRSQVALSRRLGYRANPVALWETGRRFPYAADALRACERVGIDVAAAVARFHEPTAPEFELSDRGVARWLDALRGATPIGAVATHVGRSRSAVSRWLSGDTRPRLPDLLRLVEALTGRTADLVGHLVPIEQVPAVRALVERSRAAQRLSRQQPWTAAVLRVLETKSYRALLEHRDGWIATRLGIDIALERQILADLRTAEVVAVRGDRLVLEGELRTYGGDLTLAKVHWSHVAASRIPSPGPSDLFAYAVISVSNQDLVELRQRLRAAFRAVLSEVAESEAETVALVNVQLLEWPP